MFSCGQAWIVLGCFAHTVECLICVQYKTLEFETDPRKSMANGDPNKQTNENGLLLYKALMPLNQTCICQHLTVKSDLCAYVLSSYYYLMSHSEESFNLQSFQPPEWTLDMVEETRHIWLHSSVENIEV